MWAGWRADPTDKEDPPPTTMLPTEQPAATAAADAREGRAARMASAPPTSDGIFGVPAFMLADSTCRYRVIVRNPSSGGTASVLVRWSTVEALLKDLRAVFPDMPKALKLTSYWMKTTDPAKLEARRLELSQALDDLSLWACDPDGGPTAAALLGSAPLKKIIQDNAEPGPAAATAAAAVADRAEGEETVLPSIEVPNFAIDEDSTTLYHMVVKLLDGDEKHLHVRWSEMEALVSDLRAHFPKMPKAVALPRYYRKASNDTKMEERRRNIADFWANLLLWLDEDGATDGNGRVALVESPPVERLLSTAKPIVLLALQHLQGYRVQESSATMIQAAARGWTRRLPELRRKQAAAEAARQAEMEAEQIVEAERAAERYAAAQQRADNKEQGADHHEEESSTDMLAPQQSAAGVVPEVISVQCLGIKTSAVAQSVRQDMADSAAASEAEESARLDEKVLAVVKGLEELENIRQQVQEAAIDEACAPLVKQRKVVASGLHGPLRDARDGEAVRLILV
jgi:hypothetical protein